MKRWVIAIICAVFGLAVLFPGLLVPVYLQTVDSGVIERAGRGTPTTVADGLALVKEENLGGAQMLLDSSQGVLDRDDLARAVVNLARLHPEYVSWGGGDPHLRVLLKPDAKNPPAGPDRFADYVLRLENRTRLLEFLKASTRPDVKEILRCRELTETSIFDPSLSTSGQAMDAAVTICGLLVEGGHLHGRLRETIYLLAMKANRGEGSSQLEAMLLDLTSLAQRFNWGQMIVFVSQISDSDSLRILADQVRKCHDDADVARLFAVVHLGGKPAVLAKYLMNYPLFLNRKTGSVLKTAMDDLGFSLRFGEGAVRELIDRKQPLYTSDWRIRAAGSAPTGGYLGFAVNTCLLTPGLGLALKWTLVLGAGFLFALALHFAKRAATPLEKPLEVGGLHILRELLFALGFLLMVIILSEPYLTEESQKVEYAFRLRVPTVGAVVSAGKAGAVSTFMNQINLMTMLVFFVLQGLIYTACLVKLAEIRRQKIDARIKLKLLDNEEHLFDAGLYLGFVGTIVSLILVSMGQIQFSLMAAYSSTSFGIVFVSIFKIFSLRSAKRMLILEIETEALKSNQRTPVVMPS